VNLFSAIDRDVVGEAGDTRGWERRGGGHPVAGRRPALRGHRRGARRCLQVRYEAMSAA
jgi:hypothetical protein